MTVGAPLDPVVRQRAEEFVRPLYAGLDGEQTFDRAERAWATIGSIRGEETVDEALLELLVVFHGAARRLGSLRRDSRFELFLRGQGVAPDLIESLRQALGRYSERPETPEESLLHDALLLEETGVSAVLRALLLAGRKRRPLERAVAALDSGPALERFRTRGARGVAQRRQREAAAWLADLRQRLASEAAPLQVD